MLHLLRTLSVRTIVWLAVLVAVPALLPATAAAQDSAAAPGLNPRLLADASWHGRQIQRPLARRSDIPDREPSLGLGTGFTRPGGSRRVRDLQRRLAAPGLPAWHARRAVRPTHAGRRPGVPAQARAPAHGLRGVGRPARPAHPDHPRRHSRTVGPAVRAAASTPNADAGTARVGTYHAGQRQRGAAAAVDPAPHARSPAAHARWSGRPGARVPGTGGSPQPCAAGARAAPSSGVRVDAGTGPCRPDSRTRAGAVTGADRPTRGGDPPPPPHAGPHPRRPAEGATRGPAYADRGDARRRHDTAGDRRPAHGRGRGDARRQTPVAAVERARGHAPAQPERPPDHSGPAGDAVIRGTRWRCATGRSDASCRMVARCEVTASCGFPEAVVSAGAEPAQHPVAVVALAGRDARPSR